MQQDLPSEKARLNIQISSELTNPAIITYTLSSFQSTNNKD